MWRSVSSFLGLIALAAADSSGAQAFELASPDIAEGKTLGDTTTLAEPAVVHAAERLGVSPGQVILRWHVQLGTLPIPKAASPEHQRENLDIFGFELTDEEMAGIGGLAEDDGRLFGGDPDSHEEM